MPRFCANLTMLFTERPLIERIKAAKNAGFDSVEILFPYDHPAQEIRDALVHYELELALINCPPPNFAGGNPGYAAVPESADRFQYDFKRTMRYADLLKPTHVHIMSGVADGDAAHETFVRNLTWASGFAPEQSLTIEPINRTTMPGYFLHDFDMAAGVLDDVAAPNLSLQFDAFHAHMITGDINTVWKKHGHRASHIQVGGIPDRNEPISGDFDYPAFFAQLDAEGYAGVVSGEYTPKTVTENGLDWIKQP